MINTSDTHITESWHFDCRGSYALIYNYYKVGKGANMPYYTEMTASGVFSLGLNVDKFSCKTNEVLIQSGLIRMG